MPPDSWGVVKQILEEALGSAPGDRQRLLDERCGGDQELRLEVESLLNAHHSVERGASFFGVEDVPERIGPYRILRLIARGGMGVVFLAEQLEPIRRQVAVKVIKIGMDTREVVARFEIERQALALMNHPNIAQVLDAGAGEDGRAYFAMEYVPGIPITQFCDSNRLGLRERLQLFARVCDAVQHAHQKGVIHRDIKPSNVLVMRRDKDTVPKVIDFGIAKATSLQLTRRTVFTQMGVMLGTPEYMSPEQASMSEINVDTRTDVYSLGVLLYELLTGELPFRRPAASDEPFDEILRRIRTEEPTRPSTRVTLTPAAGEIAISRRTDVGGLKRALREDLDWIVLKALEKDPARRYGTASAFAEDIERHLVHAPIEARPPSVAYRMGKYVRRNRAVVAGVAAVLVALLGGLAGTTLAWRRAERESRISRAVMDFLSEDLLRAADPNQALLPDVTVRQVLDLAESKVSKRFASDPAVEAQLRLTLGQTYESLQARDLAVANLERAVALRRRVFGADGVQTAEALEALATAVYRADIGRAITTTQDVVRIRRQRLGAGHDLTKRAEGELEMYRAIQSGQSAVDMTPMLMEALAAARGRGENAQELTDHLNDVVNTVERLWKQGNRTKARTMLRAEVEPFVNKPVFASQTPWAMMGYGMRLADQDRDDAAEALYDVALELGTQINGPNHRWTLLTEGLQARLCEKGHRDAEAESIYRKLVHITAETRSPDNLDRLTAVHALGFLLAKQERWKESEETYRDSFQVIRGTVSERGIEAARILYGYGRAVCHLGRTEEGGFILKRAASLYAASAQGEFVEEMNESLEEIARCLEEGGKPRDAAWTRTMIRRPPTAGSAHAESQ